jgi:hypothetical protein
MWPVEGAAAPLSVYQPVHKDNNNSVLWLNSLSNHSKSPRRLIPRSGEGLCAGGLQCVDGDGGGWTGCCIRYGSACGW